MQPPPTNPMDGWIMDGSSWVDRWIERCRLHAWTTGHISPVRTRHGLCVVPRMREGHVWPPRAQARFFPRLGVRSGWETTVRAYVLI